MLDVNELIREEVNYLEQNHLDEDEVFLGVSCLTADERATLKALGWKAMYVEQGTFLFIRR